MPSESWATVFECKPQYTSPLTARLARTPESHNGGSKHGCEAKEGLHHPSLRHASTSEELRGQVADTVRILHLDVFLIIP